MGQFPVANETVPEIPFFVSSPAQIGFTPDGTRLVVTIKGIRGNPLLGGTITEWVIDDTTGLITKGVQITTGSDVPFSFDFDDEDNLLVVNAFGNGEVGSGNTGSMSSYGMPRFGFLDSVNLNQTTSCWIEYSNGCAFTTNNGGNSISSLAVNDGEFSLIESIAAEVNNPIDEISSPDGRFLYVLSTGHTSGGQPSIYVYEIGSNCGLTETQVISDGIPSEVDTVFGAVGLAIF